MFCRPVVIVCLVLAAWTHAAPIAVPPKPTSHAARNIEGWTVHVDDRLLSGDDAELGSRAIRLLETSLREIKLVMAPDKLSRLQKVAIWLDRTHGGLTSMQYHPSPVWLKDHGYSTELAKCVHIPDASRFADPAHYQQQPWAVLHELAHAYHDQVIGFEDPEIKSVWKHTVDNGRFALVLHIDGQMRKHYALKDQKEFFAEMSESYFGMNDFFPFNRAELRRSEPEIFALMEKTWGPLPQLR